MEKTTLRKRISTGVAELIGASGAERYGGAAVKMAKSSQVVCIRSTSRKTKKKRTKMREKENKQKLKLDLSNAACAAKKLDISLTVVQETQISRRK